MANVSMYIWGVVFALGLGISGMAQPSKVIGFLDFMGNWDPSLMMVMLGAVSVYFGLSRFILRRAEPVVESSFALPTNKSIDGRLVAGSAIFGAGWGMAGFCPGPALTSLVTGNSSVWVFVIAMSMGMYLFGALERRFAYEPDGGAGLLDAAAEPIEAPVRPTSTLNLANVTLLSSRRQLRAERLSRKSAAERAIG